MPTQHNSALFKGSFPTVDAAVISILRNSGALIFGKMVRPSLAPGLCTLTRDPCGCQRRPSLRGIGTLCRRRTRTTRRGRREVRLRDQQLPSRTAKFRLRLVHRPLVGYCARLDATLLTPSSFPGSVIRPASYCGTFSFKPTWGSVCHEGVKPFSPTNDVVGFFSRSIEDLQLLAKVLGLTNEGPAPSLSPRPPRIAVCRTPQWSIAEQATIDVMDTAEELLKAAGVVVTLLDLPPSFDALLDYHTRIMAGEGRATFQAAHLLDSLRPDSSASLIHSDYTNYALNASNTSRAQLVDALDRAAALRPIIDKIISEFDAVLAPSAPDVAPLLATTGDPRFCSGWTLLHVPVVNVPARRKEGELPLGVSLVGRRFDDARLLEVAKEVARIFAKE